MEKGTGTFCVFLVIAFILDSLASAAKFLVIAGVIYSFILVIKPLFELYDNTKGTIITHIIASAIYAVIVIFLIKKLGTYETEGMIILNAITYLIETYIYSSIYFVVSAIFQAFTTEYSDAFI